MTIDPTTVQQLATEHILDDARRAHDIGADVLGHFGPDALTKAEYHAYCDAIREAITTATVAVSWPAGPDEHQQAERDGDSSAATVRRFADVWAEYDNRRDTSNVIRPATFLVVSDRGATAQLTEPELRSVLDGREAWRNLALSRGRERDGDVPDDLYWPFTGGLDTCYGEHDDDSDGYRECCMRAGLTYVLPLHERQVRAKVAAERDGDVRAAAGAVERLKRWLVGRQANVHSKISTTSVIAEPRDRSTAAWAIAESDVAAVVAALEARDAKAV